MVSPLPPPAPVFRKKAISTEDSESYGQWLFSKARPIVLKRAYLLYFFLDGIHQHFFFTKMSHKKNINMLGFYKTQSMEPTLRSHSIKLIVGWKLHLLGQN